MAGRFEVVIQVARGRWLRLQDPALVIQASRAADIASAIAEVERLTRETGYHAAGFVSYEAGAAFGLCVRTQPPDLPLVWFGLFESKSVSEIDAPCADGSYTLGPLTPTLDREQFEAAFRRIKKHLAEGDTYQANLTFRMQASFEGDPRRLFVDLVEAQQGRYSAFLDLGRHAICSASPELFFALSGLDVVARPMKGTVGRGRTPEEDRKRQDALRSSPKQRAENVMIVDMVRNDIGRIADIGSVAVPELFRVERYPNVWQMTSLVTARSRAPLEEIFAAVHPPASVTGAPKARTMEILSELEAEPRGVYTGAIGHIWPDGSAQFNVAIRTAIVDRERGSVQFGIGSGIVWDSDPAAEYEECLLKGSILGRPPMDFDLVETLRWTPGGGFLLLERHIHRLMASAEYFGFVVRAEAVEEALHDAVAGAVAPLRVRLTASRTGSLHVEHAPLVTSRVPLRVRLAAAPIDPNDVFLFHKTTRRAVYDSARLPDCDDVILWNPKGEVTEATIANVVVEVGGESLTPPIDCGLLAGTYRAELIARGAVREAVVTVEQLRSAQRWWLVNSVQERREAVLLG
jgi:para-aminobenzoate synthetase/4-amino-4-deoxychorismate lyase